MEGRAEWTLHARARVHRPCRASPVPAPGLWTPQPPRTDALGAPSPEKPAAPWAGSDRDQKWPAPRGNRALVQAPGLCSRWPFSVAHFLKLSRVDVGPGPRAGAVTAWPVPASGVFLLTQWTICRSDRSPCAGLDGCRQSFLRCPHRPGAAPPWRCLPMALWPAARGTPCGWPSPLASAVDGSGRPGQW